MASWEYQKWFYYTKEEQSGGAFSKSKTHQYIEYTDDQERKVFKDENVLKILNVLGRDGWELVSATPIIGQKGFGIASLFAMDPGGASVTTTQGVILWFKKPKEVDTNKSIPSAFD